MIELSAQVGKLTVQNCHSGLKEIQSFVRATDLVKQKMTPELQNHLFQMRLSIKNIYAEGLQKDKTAVCLQEAKQVLSDLRSFEEAIGHNQAVKIATRAVASESKPSLFSDSHRQLVVNSRREDKVTSLVDLKTGDILLLHRVSQDTRKVIGASRGTMDWTDVAVVYKDAEDNLYLMAAVDSKVKRRGWYQLSDWLKRSVDRVQVLRPLSESVAVATGKLDGRTLKNAHAFGDLIKKEFTIKTSTTLIASVGETVLGEDLEMSPDLVTLTEWKDYSFAYKSRMITQMIRWIDDYVKMNPSVPEVKHSKQMYYLDDVITRGVTNH